MAKVALPEMTIRRVELPYRGVLEVRGDGCCTYWRDPDDPPPWRRWTLASPDFRRQLETASAAAVTPPVEPSTAAELLREIARLYRQLQGHPATDAPLEAQIRAYADRYRAVHPWTVVSSR